MRPRHLLHGSVHVAEQVAEVNGAVIAGPPKSDAGVRTVTLPAVAVAALATHLDAWAEPGPNGLVFPAPEGGYQRRSNFRRRVWLHATAKAALRACGSTICGTLPRPWRQRPGRRPAS